MKKALYFLTLSTLLQVNSCVNRGLPDTPIIIPSPVKTPSTQSSQEQGASPSNILPATSSPLPVNSPAPVPVITPPVPGNNTSDNNWRIITVAGGKTEDIKLPDEGKATEAYLSTTQAVFKDNSGNIYIADTGNNLVRKVTPDGRIITIAGTGKKGASGDGGPAILAELNGPKGITMDNNGNILFCDSANRVKRIDLNGIITTFAGSDNVLKDENIGDNGPATNAVLRNPSGLVADKENNIYIVDTGFQRIRKVDKNGIITTFAGNNPLKEEVENIEGVRYYYIPGKSGGDGGPATEAFFNIPVSMVIDSEGNFLILDQWNEAIRKIDKAGLISTVKINYPSAPFQPFISILHEAKSISIDSTDNLYISQPSYYKIYKLDKNGNFKQITGNSGSSSNSFLTDGSLLADGILNNQSGLFTDKQDNLYITEEGLVYSGNKQSRIRMLNSQGIISTVAGGGDQFAGAPPKAFYFSYAISITTDKNDNLLIPQDTYIRAMDKNGNFRRVAGNGTTYAMEENKDATSTALQTNLITTDKNGIIYFVQARIIRKIENGVIRTVSSQLKCTNPPCYDINSIAVDSHGNIYTSEPNGYVKKFVADNGSVSLATDPVVGVYSTYGRNLLVDRDDNLYISNVNNKIIRIDNTGKRKDIAGNGQDYHGTLQNNVKALEVPVPNTIGGMASDSRGNLYFTAPENRFIGKVDQNGIFSVVAGNGSNQYEENQLSTSTGLLRPTGIAIDSQDNIYFSDYGNEKGYIIKKFVK